RRPKIVAIVETWLTPEISDQEVCLPGYQLFRRDRHTKGGGGLAAYVVEGLQVSMHRNQLLAEQPDSLWLIFRTSDRNECLTMGIIYRSPNSSPETSIAINSAIHKACTSGKSPVVILGDFNYPNINFRTGSCRGYEAITFYELTQELGLTEHVKQTTRWRDGQKDSRLDLALSNEPYLIDRVEIEAPLGLSDHAVVHLRLIATVDISLPASYQRRNYWKADFEGMKRHLSTKVWPSSESYSTVDEQWEHILGEVQHAIAIYTPVYRPKQNPKIGSLSPETKRLMHTKKRLWDTFLLMQDELSRDEYKKARNRCNAAVRSERRRRQLQLANEFIERPKKFFAHVASITKSRAALSCLEGPDGLIDANQDMADLLRQKYSSVYGQNADVKQSGPAHDHLRPRLITPDFSTTNVVRKLKLLKTGKSPGLDGVPPVVLIQCAEELAQPLSSLFMKSYSLGLIPASWKLGVISPIYKGGDRTDPSNYRPIALLSVASKVMESILDDAFRKMLNDKSFFSTKQHGFRAGFSCVTNLLSTHDEWTKAADAGNPLDAIFLDFSKAFDRVNHGILLRKLRQAGFDGPSYAWLSDYLQNRRYTVRVNNVLSVAFAAPTGVPQGSILGPLLFLVFINDLPEGIRSLVVLYADDGKISRPIRTAVDEAILQEDISTAHAWSINNKLQFNTTKCKVLHIRNSCPRTYYLGGTPLSTTEHERDLGTIVSSSLS
ncbi:MAG: reverse transcriptase family protein, partial [Aeromonas sp.]